MTVSPGIEARFSGTLGKFTLNVDINASMRGVYPGVGYSYDPVLDVFVPPMQVAP